MPLINEQWKFASDSLVLIFTVCEKCKKYTPAFALLSLVLFASLNVEKSSICLYIQMYIPYTLGKREWQSSSEKTIEDSCHQTILL